MLLFASLFSVTPVFAANHQHGELNVKDCIQHCVQKTETIGKKVERLKSEVQSGKTTVNAHELWKLEIKLKEATLLLDSLTGP